MKEIKAIIRQENAQKVLNNLEKAGAENVTLTHVLATGLCCEANSCQLNMEFGRNVATMIKLELICNDRDDLRLVKIIRDSACSDTPGDGIISVQNVNHILKIHTNRQGADAL